MEGILRYHREQATDARTAPVVVDEDATLVLAGAGAGKTSVITAKTAYLVKAGIRQPEEILLPALAKHAAEDMSERVILMTPMSKPSVTGPAPWSARLRPYSMSL